jgi:hypothetical protein
VVGTSDACTSPPELVTLEYADAAVHATYGLGIILCRNEIDGFAPTDLREGFVHEPPKVAALDSIDNAVIT